MDGGAYTHLVQGDHHLDKAGVALARRDVNRQRAVLSLLVQIGAVPQQQSTEFRVAENRRYVQRRVSGDVRAARLRPARQKQLRHAVVGPPDGVVERRASLVVLEVDVGVQLQQRVDGRVQTSTHGHQKRRLLFPLTLLCT